MGQRKMNTSDCWIQDELLQLFYTTVEDFKTGTISEETFKEKLLKLAKRYERNFIGKGPDTVQKDLP